ncbi:hypothetical protein HZA38_00065 [Candidatus Peregrinibacteria bacterium]|nr:hypothetical protein [Candidatus Peregrinibacteria bacterium]
MKEVIVPPHLRHTPIPVQFICATKPLRITNYELRITNEEPFLNCF